MVGKGSVLFISNSSVFERVNCHESPLRSERFCLRGSTHPPKDNFGAISSIGGGFNGLIAFVLPVALHAKLSGSWGDGPRAKVTQSTRRRGSLSVSSPHTHTPTQNSVCDFCAAWLPALLSCATCTLLLSHHHPNARTLHLQGPVGKLGDVMVAMIGVVGGAGSIVSGIAQLV